MQKGEVVLISAVVGGQLAMVKYLVESHGCDVKAELKVRMVLKCDCCVLLNGTCTCTCIAYQNWK